MSMPSIDRISHQQWELRVPPLFVALRLFILHWIVLRRDKNIHLSRGIPRFLRGTRGDQLSPTGYKDGDYNWLPINCQWGGDQKDITEPYVRIRGEGSFYQAYVGRTFSKFLFLSNSIELLKRSWWNDFFIEFLRIVLFCCCKFCFSWRI